MRHHFGILIAIAIVVAGGIAFAAYNAYDNSDEDNADTSSQTQEVPQEQTNSSAAGTQLASETQKYKVTFDVNWTNDTHASTLPPGPHLSPMVVVTHSSAGELFTSGQTATDGVEQMAETGATSILQQELQTKLASDGIFDFKVGKRVDSPGSDVIEITANEASSLLSFVSMLAPSPDWFVGVNSVNLFNNGQWVDKQTLDIKAYDSGTDSGETFTASDIDTQPRSVISSPVDSQFVEAANTPFGSITIERQ